MYVTRTYHTRKHSPLLHDGALVPKHASIWLSKLHGSYTSENVVQYHEERKSSQGRRTGTLEDQFLGRPWLARQTQRLTTVARKQEKQKPSRRRRCDDVQAKQIFQERSESIHTYNRRQKRRLRKNRFTIRRLENAASQAISRCSRVYFIGGGEKRKERREITS